MTAPDYEALSKGVSLDMSSRAIAERLRIASELYDLARILSTARYRGPVEPRESDEDPGGSSDAPGTSTPS